MRHRPASAIAIVALFAALSAAAAQSQSDRPAQAAPPAPQPGAPPSPAMSEPAPPQPAPSAPQRIPPQITEQIAPAPPALPPQPSPPAQPQQEAAPSATQPGAPPPAGQGLASPQQQKQGEEATATPSGQAGKQEPSASGEAAAKTAAPVSVGLHGVAGMPEDGQTTPAKYSKRNSALDRLPLVALRLKLDDAQRKAILEVVRKADAPIAKIEASIAQELPATVTLQQFPQAARDDVPALAGLDYVRLQDRILLVRAPNMVVVGEIAE
jgi:hypothetical protein